MFIYAETALHHEGNLDYLIKLIDCAKKYIDKISKLKENDFFAYNIKGLIY